MAGDVKSVSFPIDLLLDVCADAMEVSFNGSSLSVRSASKSQTVKEVDQSAGFRRFVSRSVFPMESDS